MDHLLGIEHCFLPVLSSSTKKIKISTFMKLIWCISVTVFTIGGLCSPIPSTSTSTYTDNLLLNSEFNEYFADKIQSCINQAPANHGLLIHFEQVSSPKDSPSFYTRNVDDGTRFEKRFFKSLYKTFKGMPAEQRISVFNSMASAYALPSFMTSAAQAWDAEQISNIKSKAAEIEVKKSKKGITKKPSNKVIIPPPPPHIRKRSALEKRTTPLNKLQKSNTFTKSILHSSHGSGGGSPRTVQSVMQHSTSMINKPKVKEEKKANPTVSKVLTWVSGSINLLYIPVAWMTTHKVQRVTDDDTHSYKKRNYNQNDQFPIITCIPIARKSKNDFVIPTGAL